MASKVKFNKISSVAVPTYEIGEDQVDEHEIEASMLRKDISSFDRLETFSDQRNFSPSKSQTATNLD